MSVSILPKCTRRSQTPTALDSAPKFCRWCRFPKAGDPIAIATIPELTDAEFLIDLRDRAFHEQNDTGLCPWEVAVEDARWAGLSDAGHKAESDALDRQIAEILRESPLPPPTPAQDGETPIWGGLASFERTFSPDADTGPLPALMERTDGATVIYAGKLNSIFGTPGSGKSWVSLIAVDNAVMKGGNVLYWDFEDSPATFQRRSLMIGFDPIAQAESFKYVTPGMDADPLAMAQAREWLASAVDPAFSLVVIDAAESAGCPSSGDDVVPWYSKFVDPWRLIGATVLIVDHIPKRSEDRPRGAIGSQHKLARIDGAALAVSGVPWTKQTGGHITLTNHKDRGGDLDVPVGKAVAVIKGNYAETGGVRTFGYRIEMPEAQDDDTGLNLALLAAIGELGGEGVTGARALRGLVNAKGTAVDNAALALVDGKLLSKTPIGRGFTYNLTIKGMELLGEMDN